MKTITKVATSVLALASVAAVSVAGTLAYLQAQTPTAVNAQTVGNVKVVQSEWERVVDENGKWVAGTEVDGYGYTPDQLQPFTQGKQWIPAVYHDGDVKWDDRNGSQAASGTGSHQQSWGQIGAPGSNQLFDDSVENVIDKFVFVENVGSTDAYYRTIIAVENPDGIVEDAVHVNRNGNARFAWDKIGNVTIDGTQYYLYVATHTEILPAGEVSRPSLLQLFLDPAATNEDIEAFGETMDVLVITQAVQASAGKSADEMLDTAFGDISAGNHPWSETTAVANEEALVAAEGSVIIDEDIELTGQSTPLSKTATIILNSGSITADRSDADTDGAATYSTLTVYGDVTIDGIGAVENTSGYAISVRDENASLTINGGTYKGGTTAINVADGDLTINGGFFEVEDGGYGTTYLINCNDANYRDGSATVTITGGTFVNWNPANSTSENPAANFVADGYTVVSETQANGDVWYTVVAE